MDREQNKGLGRRRVQPIIKSDRIKATIKLIQKPGKHVDWTDNVKL